jgi:hypothetical protein
MLITGGQRSNKPSMGGVIGGIMRTLSRVVSLKSKDLQAAVAEAAPVTPRPPSAHVGPRSKYEAASMVSYIH